MCDIFEITEKESMNWVDIMCSDYKEELCSDIIAYKIPRETVGETVGEYIIYNRELDKCIILKTDSKYKLKYFIVDYKTQIYLQSPDHLKCNVVYNLTKMTSKCNMFKLRKLGLDIVDWFLDIFDSNFEIEYIIVEALVFIFMILFVFLTLSKVF